MLNKLLILLEELHKYVVVKERDHRYTVGYVCGGCREQALTQECWAKTLRERMPELGILQRGKGWEGTQKEKATCALMGR